MGLACSAIGAMCPICQMSIHLMWINRRSRYIRRPKGPWGQRNLRPRTGSLASVALRVRTLSAAEHLAFVRACPSVSFLQTPAWGEVKREWRAESIGWFDGDGSEAELAGAGLVLYRRLPRMRRSLAYLPEGPAINWADADLASWLTPLTEHVTEQGAFGIRMGPPVATKRWSAATVKSALASDE